ncbi:MAG: bifunctional folylpolyglutamate synthase/dihydrofolate synthase [Fusobacteriaceae bacterium]|jgi:dihydrofolate synthase/folylpolyglutamate synthase|nr:bifunctional folylpolyglutamate synthase/dihydrofolate synthase [Fusobacteriaceae bacterium]
MDVKTENPTTTTQNNIDALLEELYAYSMHGIKLGLENIRILCRMLGNPQRRYKVIHIAGTNGKGSVTATIDNVLRKAGCRVGRYISPHILRFNERIAVDGEYITDEEIARYYGRVREAIAISDVKPTFFEVTTAMMFLWFADKGVEYAVVETGMGGRFDATNICDDLICVITNVTLEHTEFLGKTVRKISREKAGIIKHCRDVIVGDSKPTFLGQITKAMPKGAWPVNVLAKYKGARFTSDYDNFTITVHVDGKSYVYSLFGDYQFKNFLCAYEALKRLRVSEEAMIEGFATTVWECRFERWSKDPLIILDGAHNADGMAELAKIIRKGFARKDVVVITSILKDKKIEDMGVSLDSMADTVIFTAITHNPRGLRGEEVLARISSAEAEHLVENDLGEAARLAREMNKKLTLVCGSFYLLSEWKEKFTNQ